MSMIESMPSFPNHPPLRARLIALGAISSVDFLENGMVAFATSQIMAGLHLSAQEFAFAYTLYGVGAIFMLYKHQWMVERLSYRRFVLLSLAVFGLGSLLCAVSNGLAQFAAGRLLQGLGGATFFTAGRLAINEFPEDARFAGLKAFLASFLGASAIAPLLAVGLMEVGQWRAIFWFGVPQTLIVGWIAQSHLSRVVTPQEERSTEHWGWLLWMCLGFFFLQYAIQGMGLDASQSSTIAVTALVSVIILAIFAWQQWRKERPLIDFRSLAQPRYLLGLTMYFFGYFLIGSSGLMVPTLLHAVLGLTLFETAAIMSCAMLAGVVMALVHTVLARRHPRHRLFMLTGLGLYGCGSLLLAVMNGRSGWLSVLPAILTIYLAIPLFLGPVAAGTFTELHGKAFSHGYQVKNIVRQLGLSSSVAVTTLALHLIAPDPERASTLSSLTQTIADLGIGAQSHSILCASKQIFAVMATAVVPAGVIVMVQRVFR